MGCVNSHPIKHPKKPLPTIPQHQTSIIGTGPNNNTLPNGNGSIMSQDRNNSIGSVTYQNNPIDSNYSSSTANGYSSQQQTLQQLPSPDQPQTPLNDTTKSKKKGFLGTWGKKPKMNRSTSVASSTYSTRSEVSASQGLRPHNVPLPTPPSNNNNSSGGNKNAQKIVIALYAYEGRDEGELSFDKNDKLVIVDSNEPDWWLAYKLTAPERKGYIPMNFVVNNVIETEE